MKTSIIILVEAAILGGLAYLFLYQPPSFQGTAPISHVEHIKPAAPSLCDASLWAHVYHGRFKTAQDRLKVITPCVTVTGTIVNAKAEADGDIHIRLKLDTPYQTMLNSKNKSGQNGYLVLEPVCQTKVTQKDTTAEGVCSHFAQKVFTKTMINKHVLVTGAYVTDMEHGWNEIHPVSTITIIEPDPNDVKG